MPVEYVLQRTAASAPAPVLDDSQRAVLEHGIDGQGGPLLVLAGPGTGKTTTLVELVVDRVERGLPPDDALVLTFSRKAAAELRSRIARRLPGAGVVPVMTFHSYCYALVRAASPPELFADPLRLLSAPEQEWRMAEVLLGASEMGRVSWPTELQPALRTRGFARELVDFVGRARSYGLDPDALRRLSGEHGEPAWHSVADLWTEYEQVLALSRETDYSGLVDEASRITPVTQPRLVVVDEYQDTDPAQVALLQGIVGPSTDLVAVGDPDQSIYAFRGADVRGIWTFADRFGTPERPAATVALRRSRRFGPALMAASRAVISPLGVSGSISRDQFTAFRQLEPIADLTGEIEVRTFTDARAEAEQIAVALHHAHREGLPWGDMAVLVRSGRESIPRFERVLRAAGIPTEVAGDEIPIAEQPAVRALLLAAHAAAGLASGRQLVPEEAETLLLGPLGRLDPSELRSLARELRRRAAGETGTLRDSRELLAECLAEPASLAVAAPGQRLGSLATRAERLAMVLARTADLVRHRAPAEQVLWELWDGTDWPRRLQSTAESGDVEAHRDLDALVALFDDAARAEESGRRAEIGPYIDALRAQQIPGDSLAERGVRGDAVRVMTAHRSKGLEWDLVVVAGVQDGLWPATRAAHSLLRTERLDPRGDGRPPSFGALLAEERRLFYVAVTRARRRLLVTAVESMASDGEQPSRFVDELRPFSLEQQPPQGRPRRPASLRGVVAELRDLAETGATDRVRAEAATRLAGMSGDVSAADPDRWWGTADLTQASRPIRPIAEPLALSGSAVDGITGCALRWFLSREVKGEQGTTTAQGFGLALHVLAAEVVDTVTPDVDPETLIAHLDAVWHRLDFDTPWIAARERDEAVSAVRRLVRWHRDRGERSVLGAEQEFVVEIPVGDDVVRLRGSMDRVEVGADGRIHVVDFKTGKGKPTAAEIEQHAQLGVYQVAVAHGAVPGHDTSAGAELVHLRQEFAREPGLPVVQQQDPPSPGEPFFAYELLRRSRDSVRLERFEATVNERCQICPFRRCCPAQAAGDQTVEAES